MKIRIIGRGNVACNLQHALAAKGLDVPMSSSREGLDALPAADCYIYAVHDEALREVAAQVHAPHALHLHTSGTMPMDVFGEDKPHAGVLYFFQSFSKEHLIDDWTQIPCFIEGRRIDDVAAIYALAQMLTSHIYETTSHDRERLHVAGVLANNFTNALYRMAADMLRDTAIPFEALLPLIDETARKVHTLTPAAAQTGPAKRHDERVMHHHLELLPTDDQRQIYQLLSRYIQHED